MLIYQKSLGLQLWFSLSVNVLIIFFNYSTSCLVYKMSESGAKMLSQSPRWRPQMSCFVHNPKIFSLLPSTGVKKPENIHIWETEIWEFWVFSWKKWIKGRACSSVECAPHVLKPSPSAATACSTPVLLHVTPSQNDSKWLNSYQKWLINVWLIVGAADSCFHCYVSSKLQ